MKKSEQAIGMFDSGAGGLTVMREIAQALPNEDIIYFADTARLPYGTKSRETIVRYAIENVIFLMEHRIKVLVVACNTASAHALEKLQNLFNIPLVEVIGPGSEKAAQVTTSGHIAVLGTKGTIASGAYQKEIQKHLPHSEIIAIPCPLFVPLVEEKFIQHPVAKLIVKEYLKPLEGKKIDTLLLGCTHYPLLAQLIKEEVGPEVTIVDSASTCAEKVASILSQRNLKNGSRKEGEHKYFVSDDPDKFKALGEEILGREMANVYLS